MSIRTILIGSLAVVFGLSAAVGVNLFAKQNNAHPDSVSIIVADADFSRGDTISEKQVTVADCQRDLLPAGVATDMQDVVGRVVRNPIQKGEPILDVKLAPRGAKNGLAGLIPSGMRAFTIQTPNVAANVAGFLLPGNRVDVLLTLNGDDGTTGGGITVTLLQNVEILGVDNLVDAPTERKVDARHLQSVTLIVTPDQAAMLDLGQNRGTLHLSLRNPDDAKQADTRAATMHALQRLQDQTHAAVKPKTRPNPAVAVAPTPRKESSADKRPLQIRILNGQYYGVVPLEAQDLPEQSQR